MNSDDLLSSAAASGFEVISGDEPVDAQAARLLPNTEGALATRVAGDVLRVLVDHIPTPGEFRQLEQTAGMLVSIAVTTPANLNRLRGVVVVGSVPRGIGPALERAVAEKASDVHLTTGMAPILRIDGVLVPMSGWQPLSANEMEEAVAWLTGESEQQTRERDLAVTYSGSRWRAAVYRQRGALAVTLRRIPDSIPRLEELGLPGAVTMAAERTRGLVLFSGETGSGKSTSLAAVIDRINRTRSCKIITLEDPVEYLHRSAQALVHQREVGSDTESFASGLRAALRQDPDVILVGELRDRETIQVALTAGETGHLVLATLHAPTAAGVIDRVVNVFPAEQQTQIRVQLAATLEIVVAQQLLPRRNGGGRQLVCETLVTNTAVRNLIREGRLHELNSAMEAGTSFGMTTMDRSLADLVAAGRIAPELAERHVTDLSSYQEHLRRSPVVAHDDITTEARRW